MRYELITLRQRKLLNYLQNQSSLVSGDHLARYLHVSVRTVRSDIAEINANLSASGITVVAEKSKGYRLQAENPDILKELTQKSDSFATREDRVRYLAFTLCLSDIPVNMYDLEDEMFVSHTTLEHDLHHLNMQYVLAYPRIRLIQKKGYLEFEHDERKRRAILTRLFCDDWNYHTRENAYYSYDYLDNKLVDLIMEKVSYYLDRYGIRLEDKGRVTLNLAIAVMYERTKTGHALENIANTTDTPPTLSGPSDDSGMTRSGNASAEQSGSPGAAQSGGMASSPAETAGEPRDTELDSAINELLDELEEILHFTISPAEREEIYLMAAHNRLLDTDEIRRRTPRRYFSEEILRTTDAYLEKIRGTFHIDLCGDEDFYITLCQYVRYLSLPYHGFNTFQLNPNLSRGNLRLEFEIAVLFQDLATKYLGYYLNHTELMYLAFCISGALEYFHHSEKEQFHAAICCHLNLTATWALKRKIMSKFGYFLHIDTLLPVNATKIYDFSKVDLVLTTVNKPITDCPTAKVIYISPFMTAEDVARLENVITQKRLERIASPTGYTLGELLGQAFWHEQITGVDRLSVLHTVISDFIEAGYVGKDYYEDVLRRESISTFAFMPGIVLIYSLKPSKKTCLSVATLKHRMTWNAYKIRTVIAAALRPEDAALIFQLIQRVYEANADFQVSGSLKTRDELIAYFR